MMTPRPLLSPASALLALAVAGAACSRPAPQTRFLNFDPESSAGALLTGWSSFEKTPEGDTFAWAQAREASVTVSASGPGDRLLRFRVWPFGWDGAPPQTVTPWVNDVRLATIPLVPGAHVYSTTSPGPAWRNGANVVKLEFAFAEAPKDRIPGGGDARTLAAAFDWVEIIPVGERSAPRP